MKPTKTFRQSSKRTHYACFKALAVFFSVVIVIAYTGGPWPNVYALASDPNTIPVASSSDDVTVYNSAFYRTGTVLYLGNDGGNPCKNAIRFASVPIPPKALITSAKIVFTSWASTTRTSCNLIFYGEKTANATQIASLSDFNSRTLTSAKVEWNNVGSWTYQTAYYSPDLTPILQELVNQASWRTNNAMNIFANDDGSSSGACRYAASYDKSSTYAARLAVTYSLSTTTSASVSSTPLSSSAFPHSALIAWGGLYSSQMDQIAKFDLVLISSQSYRWVPMIRSKNPDCIILGYWDFVITSNYAYSLRDSSNNPIVCRATGAFVADPRLQSWKDRCVYMAQTMLSQGYDGIFADDCWTKYQYGLYGINKYPAGGQARWTNEYWQTQLSGLLAFVKQRIGTKLLISNTFSDAYLAVTDGCMLENFASYSWHPHIEDVDAVAEYSARGKYVIAAPHEERYTGADTQSNFLYHYACYLLGIDGQNSHFSWLDIWTREHSGGTSRGYYPQMTLSYGKPLGKYYKVSSGVYARDFENYRVTVNFNTKTGTIVAK